MEEGLAHMDEQHRRRPPLADREGLAELGVVADLGSAGHAQDLVDAGDEEEEGHLR